MKESVKEPNISIYFFFPPITQLYSISYVLFTGGRGVSDFNVLKYYRLNINYSVNILSECLYILIDCSQLSKICYNILVGSSTRDCHAQCIYWRTKTLNVSCMTISGGRTEQHVITGFGELAAVD